ncbi:MAG: TIGR01777 family protein [Acidimicrobiales bacterium]|nr:TIGR01777 family protein [Acidimicrobiales bacterium]RZV48042.1 MAG: TIGR01777 family protein [Acidimicrobiales bacterium]
MKVAIAGSTGLLGSAMVEALEARGDEVVALVRRPPRSGEIQWDIAAGILDPGALEGLDAVINLAGEPLANKKWSDEQKKRIEDSRIAASSLLAASIAAADAGPKVWLNGSAVGFYGDRGSDKLTEESTGGSGYLADVVQQWEEATAEAEAAGVRVVHLRTGIVLSADGGAMAEVLPFFKIGLGGRIGKGDQYWSWISINDAVGAMLHALDNEVVSGPINLTGPTPLTNAAYTKALGKALGRPTPFPTPTPALWVRLGRETTEEMLMTSLRVLPQKLLDTGYVFRHETMAEALEELL